MGVNDWSKTPAENAIKGNIDWSEGMSPANVNDSAREMMADLAKMFLDRSGAVTSTGSAGVYALLTNSGITQLKAGVRLTFKANVASVGGDTLNVDGKGAKKLLIVDDDGERDIVANEIDAGGFYDVIYDPAARSGAGAWIVQTADFTAIEAVIASVQTALNAHTANTSNPHGVTKAQVGLSEADNTSDADKPVSTAQAAAISQRAAKTANLSDLSNKATARSNLGVMSSAEVSAAIDASEADIQAALDLKAPIYSPEFTGNVTAVGAISAGIGSGGSALTVNDGGGNANVTFNHRGALPEQNGNAGRIHVNTDSTTGAYMRFELASGVQKDVSPSMTLALEVTETMVKVLGSRAVTQADYGPGNGINADLLDGQHASHFATAAALAALTGDVDVVVSNVRLGAQISEHIGTDLDLIVPSGSVVTGVQNIGDSTARLYSRPIQKLVGGTWYTVGVV